MFVLFGFLKIVQNKKIYSTLTRVFFKKKTDRCRVHLFCRFLLEGPRRGFLCAVVIYDATKHRLKIQPLNKCYFYLILKNIKNAIII